MIAFLLGSRFYVKKSPQRSMCKSGCYQKREVSIGQPYGCVIAIVMCAHTR